MNGSLNDVMLRFAKFLSASWDAAQEAAGILEQIAPGELISDWMQANWEILVEGPYRECAGFDAYLEPYGEGADCNDNSSRVWLPEVLPTHRIVCQPRDDAPIHDLLTGAEIDRARNPVVFDHFAARSKEGWHEQAPPFDCVVAYVDEEEVLVRVDEVRFVAEAIEE